MKKKILILSVLLLIPILSFAWSIAHFDSPGKMYKMEGNITGNFNQSLQGLYKYTSGTMYVYIESYKPGLLGIGWTSLGERTSCQFDQKIGTLTGPLCYSTVSNSGTKNIKTEWTQGSQSGYITADIYR